MAKLTKHAHFRKNKLVRFPANNNTFQKEDGDDSLADLLATWVSIRREIDGYRTELRARGGVPFADM